MESFRMEEAIALKCYYYASITNYFSPIEKIEELLFHRKSDIIQIEKIIIINFFVYA